MIEILAPKSKIIDGILSIPSSKSISNRALIIQALSNEKINLSNLSISDDTNILKDSLKRISDISKNETLTLDVGMAGTAFRFLTAFLCIQKGTFLLKGSTRLQERPIKPLVDILKQLGADIKYIDKDGFAPLQIRGKKLNGSTIEIDASISSQFITALMLIAPKIDKGLTIKLKGKIASLPYINMTIKMMQHFGIEVHFDNNHITIPQNKYLKNKLKIEADWSSASYFYEILAISKTGELILDGYEKKSIQGDSVLTKLFLNFGIETIFEKNKIKLVKNHKLCNFFKYNFINEPDLVQAIASTCVALNIEGEFSGIDSLKIKETDRILALKTEINKFNWDLIETKKGVYSLKKLSDFDVKNKLVFKTYNDHRMAMCLAPLALVFKSVFIEKHEVVSKSNPIFWDLIEGIGFKIVY